MAPGRLTRRDALRLTSVSLVGLAGCARSRSDDTMTLSQPAPTTAEATSVASSGVESLPTDHPALAWGVKLPKPLSTPPTIDPGSDSIYIGVRKAGIQTPAEEGSDAPFGALFSLKVADGKGQWAVATDAPVLRRPVVNEGWVHVVTGFSTGMAGGEQRIVAHSRHGDRRWQTSASIGTVSILTAATDTIFAGTIFEGGSPRPRLYAVRSDGELHWERQGIGVIDAVVVGDTLLGDHLGSDLVAVDVETGTERWNVEQGPIGNQRRSLVVFDGRWFTNSPDDELVARSTTDDSEVWRYAPDPHLGRRFSPNGIADVEHAGSEFDDVSIVGTDAGGFVFALDDGGMERWTNRTYGNTYDGLVVGDAIYFGDREGTLYALDPSNGLERWQASMPGFPYVFPLSNGVLAFVDGEEQSILASFRRDGSERWRYSTNEYLTWPTVAGGRAYVGGPDGSVLAFRTV